MPKGRIEAFSDGVIAILITIMVLELKVPHGASWETLCPLWPVFFFYALSFVYIGIYWNNHHHIFQAVKTITGAVLWANLHLLFWLSLFSFATGWMGENRFATLPVALYGVVLSGAALAFYILTQVLVSHHGAESTIATALADGFKEKLSLAGYFVAVPLAFVNRWISCAIYVVIALMWLIPDRRIERHLG